MNEILKLKRMLEADNIPFDFNDRMFGGTVPAYLIIIRDINTGEQMCDAIFFEGSLGHSCGLLEIMGGLTRDEENDSDVLGWLTAEEVYKRFKYCYYHNTKYYVKD